MEKVMSAFLLNKIGINIAFRTLSKMTALSDLSFIEISNHNNPGSLFQEWRDEARNCGLPLFTMDLATSTRNGKVRNGTVSIKEIMPDASITFSSQLYSEKVKNICENPQVAASILLMYINNGCKVSRQVRLIGTAEKLSQEQCRTYFDKQKLPAKIRTWLSQECKPTDWDDYKKKHDKLLEEIIENKKNLQMPDTMVAYKVIPREVDFYYSVDDKIGDRILFKQDDNGAWTYERMMP